MLEGVIRGYSGLQGEHGATRGSKGLPKVIEVTKDYPGLQGVTWGYTWLQGLQGSYRRLVEVTRG